jgi:hypothetical protein
MIVNALPLPEHFTLKETDAAAGDLQVQISSDSSFGYARFAFFKLQLRLCSQFDVNLSSFFAWLSIRPTGLHKGHSVSGVFTSFRNLLMRPLWFTLRLLS